MSEYIEYTEEQKQQHLALCRSCPNYVTVGEYKQCSKCGCTVDYNNQSTIYKCPESKW